MAGFEINHDEVEKRQAAQASGEETGTLMTPRCVSEHVL